MAVNEQDMEDFLREILEESDQLCEMAAQDEKPGFAGVGRVKIHRFQDVGMMTCNKGLVVEVGKDKFQITIVRHPW